MIYPTKERAMQVAEMLNNLYDRASRPPSVRIAYVAVRRTEGWTVLRDSPYLRNAFNILEIASPARHLQVAGFQEF